MSDRTTSSLSRIEREIVLADVQFALVASRYAGDHSGWTAIGHPTVRLAGGRIGYAHKADAHPVSGDRWETSMSGTDKANNKIEDLGGKAKEGLGKVTGDRSTENEGKADQTKSSLKDAGEKIKDAFKK